MESSDYQLALKLQSEFDNDWENLHQYTKSPLKRKSISKENVSAAKRSRDGNLVDSDWETVDPNPDIYSLFMTFNKRFFWDKLGSVQVSWSSRMYSCAGVCSYKRNEGVCSVRLSEPLLKLRPRSDLVETLLHEMIHAYLFVTDNDTDRDGHGPQFHSHMYRINKLAGTNITVYHDFIDEVKHYQKHWWRCDGVCNTRPPFFGLVKRTMNRAPGPRDFWWNNHQIMCGGTFIKIKEPPPTAKTSKKKIPLKASATSMTKYITSTKKPIPPIFGINDKPKPASKKVVGGAIKKIPATSTVVTTNTNTNRVTGFKDLGVNGSNKLPKQNVFSGEGNKLGGGYVNKRKTPSGINKGSGTFKPKNSDKSNTVTTKNTSQPFVSFSGLGNRLGSASSSESVAKPGCSKSKSNNSIIDLISSEKYKDDFLNKRISDSVKINNNSNNIDKKHVNNFMNKSQSDDELSVIEIDDSLCGNYKKANKNKFMNKSQSDDELSVIEIDGSLCGNYKKANENNFMNKSQSDDELSVIEIDDSLCGNYKKANKNNFMNKSQSDDELSAIEIDDSFCDNDKKGNDKISWPTWDHCDDDVDVDDILIGCDDEVNCPVCDMKINRDDTSIHLQTCDILNASLQTMNNSGNLEIDANDIDDNTVDDKSGDAFVSTLPCPCCSKSVVKAEINKHLDECLSLLAIKEFEKEW